MHPLVNNLETFKTVEIEAKLAELSKKYFLTSNSDLQFQIGSVLDCYREELQQRRSDDWKKAQENRDKGLDKLIKID